MAYAREIEVPRSTLTTSHPNTMNLDRAIGIYAGVMDGHHDLYPIGGLVQAYNCLDGLGLEKHAAAMLEKVPNLLQWDERGNYVGDVSNENGWTP